VAAAAAATPAAKPAVAANSKAGSRITSGTRSTPATMTKTTRARRQWSAAVDNPFRPRKGEGRDAKAMSAKEALQANRGGRSGGQKRAGGGDDNAAGTCRDLHTKLTATHQNRSRLRDLVAEEMAVF
jgi:hypothetical protein